MKTKRILIGIVISLLFIPCLLLVVICHACKPFNKGMQVRKRVTKFNLYTYSF
jgi:hypothetical protein